MTDLFLLIAVMTTVFAALFCIADMISEFRERTTHRSSKRRMATRRSRHPWIVTDDDYPRIE